MLNSFSIQRKLGAAFVLVIASAAVMMAVFLANILMIRSAIERNNLSQQIHAEALTLESALLRQNSQMRGFLVTGDDSYLKSYNEARDDFDQTAARLEGRRLQEKYALTAATKRSMSASVTSRHHPPVS